MKLKKIVVSLILVFILAAIPVFAEKTPPAPPVPENPFDYEAVRVGQTLLNAGVSVGWGFGFDLGADFIIGRFDPPRFPMEWGIGIRGLAEFGWFGGFDWGVSGLWTLHKGFSFGKNAEFDFYIGIGVGIGGYTSAYYGFPFGVGFSTFDGLAWKIDKTVALLMEYGGIYGWNVSTSVFSIGVRFTL